MSVLELVVPRRLNGQNRGRGFHWSRAYRDTKQWEQLLAWSAASLGALRDWSLVTYENVKDERGLFRPKEIRRQERRRVTVERQVVRQSHFIQDDDNLRFSVKPVNDALKRLGLIFDDSREWLDQPMPEQRVAEDRVARTIIRIERLV